MIRGKGSKALHPPKEDDNPLQRFVFNTEGLKPELNCTMCPKEIQYSETTTSKFAMIERVSTQLINNSLEAVFRLPSKCHNIDSKQATVVSLPYMYTNVDMPSLIGKFFDLNITSSHLGTPSAADHRIDPEGCPSRGILFGYYQNITALPCSQRMRSVSMSVTYRGDIEASTLNAQRPPVVFNNSSPRYIFDETSGLPTLSYNLGQHWDSELSRFPNLSLNATDRHAGTKSQDGLSSTGAIFDHLLHGPYNVSEADIVGPERAQNLITAFNKVYNRYMVQVLNTVLMSSSTNATAMTTITTDGALEQTNARTVNGTLTRQTTRLKMNNASKLTLQIMLAVMVALSGLAIHLIKIRGTLPRDPYSIASVMGFLAGSEMCTPQSEIFPPGSEFLSIGELSRRLRVRSFRLGWWDAPNTEKNGTASSCASRRGSMSGDVNLEHNGVTNEHFGSRDEELIHAEDGQDQRGLKGTTRFGIDVEDSVRECGGGGNNHEKVSL